MSPTIVDLTASSPAVTTLSEELPVETVLKHAILDAQLERLRVTLQHICNDSPEAFRIARSLLLVPEEIVKHKTIDRRNRLGDDTDQDEDEDEDEEDSSEPSDSEDDTENSDDTNGEDDGGEEEEEEDGPRALSNGFAVIPTSGVKRLRSRFATCTNCSEEFDVTDNGKYSCVWHPGTLANSLLWILVRGLTNS